MAKKMSKKQAGGSTISSSNSGYKASMDSRTTGQKIADKARAIVGKGPKIRASFKKGGAKKSK